MSHDGRRNAGLWMTRRQSVIGMVLGLGGMTAGVGRAWADDENGILHSAEVIHQEPLFAVAANKVYDALIDPKQFQQVQLLSGVMKAAVLTEKPAQISREPGSAFSLFGGYITGRQIELVPNKRLVQAWRTGRWPDGVYSIAKFELVENGTGTKIEFDQTGFPAGEAEHLAAGWKANYWDAMNKFLSL